MLVLIKVKHIYLINKNMSLKIVSNKILHTWINPYDNFKVKREEEFKIITIKIVCNI